MGASIFKIGENTKVWYFVNILNGVVIGDNCTIGSYTEIGEGVKIGNDCKIEAMVFIPKGVTIGNEVFVGPRVSFVNDKYPKATGEWKVYDTVVEDGASIGAASVLLCGIRIGRGAKIGAGSVVTKSIPDGETWVGNPAKAIVSKW